MRTLEWALTIGSIFLSPTLLSYFQMDAKGHVNSLTTELGQEADRFNSLLKVIKVIAVWFWIALSWGIASLVVCTSCVKMGLEKKVCPTNQSCIEYVIERFWIDFQKLGWN